ncbi:MAG: hypothetical protein ABIP48_30380 [Planctomycetota bacterium]
MSDHEITRRQFVGGSMAASLLAAAEIESQAEGEPDGARYRLFWGDLHNHCDVGYAKGSLERSIDNAQGHLDVTLNGRPMGAQLPATTDRQIDVRVRAEDAISAIELVRNGRVIDRHFPDDHAEQPLKLPGRAKCRIQYGWGPWAALDLGHTCVWDMRIRIRGGRFLRAIPCFQSAPFEEDLRDKLCVESPTEIHLESYTSRVKCFAEDPTKALVCELEAGPDAELSVELLTPAEQVVRARLADLVDDNVVTFTGVFTSESTIIHRLVGPSEYSADVRFHDRRPEAEPDWYYVRVTEKNGHMAWSSPIWVG